MKCFYNVFMSLMALPLAVVVNAVPIATGTMTVFGVQETDAAGQPIVQGPPRPIGESDGTTTYLQEIGEAVATATTIDGKEVSTTITASIQATVVGNANGYVFSAVDPDTAEPFQVYRSCTFGPRGRGSCVEEVFDGESTQTKTVSGTAVPLATLVNGVPTSAGRLNSDPVPLFRIGSVVGLGMALGAWVVL